METETAAEAAAAAPAEEKPPVLSSTATTSHSNKDEANRDNKKRARHHGGENYSSAYESAYRGFSFTRLPPTGRPGTPHRFFAESYAVHRDDDTLNSASASSMRVHRHANGLCVVAATATATGAALGAKNSDTNSCDETASSAMTSSIEFQCQATPDMSTAEKRKRAATMLKKKSGKQKQSALPDGAVRPSDPLVTITTTKNTTKATTTSSTTTTKTFPAVVFGSVLELNTELTVDLLRNDPLLKGHLAIILPSGPFPPPSSMQSSEQQQLETTTTLTEIEAAAAAAADQEQGNTKTTTAPVTSTQANGDAMAETEQT